MRKEAVRLVNLWASRKSELRHAVKNFIETESRESGLPVQLVEEIYRFIEGARPCRHGKRIQQYGNPESGYVVFVSQKVNLSLYEANLFNVEQRIGYRFESFIIFE